MHFYIKNMVCSRCIMVVKQELEQLNIQYAQVSLGEVETSTEPSADQLNRLSERLNEVGFELLGNSKQQLIAQIKNIINEQVNDGDQEDHLKYSEVLSKSLHKDYSYLSSLFSRVEGITIEKYIINQKIERVKELIIYNQLTLNDIAYQLNYSSVAHLSRQFKQVTGLTPTHFRQIGNNKKKASEEV
jgi:AraC-like DNA-binding protein